MGTEMEVWLQVVQRVDAAEAAGSIGPWDDELPPDKLLEDEPSPGDIVETRELEDLGATELTLGNGMRVAFRHSDLLEDQILLSGFAPGGLSEEPLDSFRNASLGCMLAEEMGMFGFKPPALLDMLAGMRVSISAAEGAFWRKISGDLSPLDLEVAMQLIHKLFTHEVCCSLTFDRKKSPIPMPAKDPLAKTTNTSD
jgi:hypothetical protein